MASYGDRAASVSALRAIGTLFMVSGSETPDRVRQHLAFIDRLAIDGSLQ